MNGMEIMVMVPEDFTEEQLTTFTQKFDDLMKWVEGELWTPEQRKEIEQYQEGLQSLVGEESNTSPSPSEATALQQLVD